MTRSHEFGSCLVTSSSAMEALGSPSISWAPMGGGHAFRIPKTSVCRWQVQRQYTSVPLREIHFVRFCLCFFLFLFFFLYFFFFFFASLHNMKSRKKTTLQITTTYEPVENNTLLCRSFYRLSREKSVKSMSYLNSYIKVYLMH